MIFVCDKSFIFFCKDSTYHFLGRGLADRAGDTDERDREQAGKAGKAQHDELAFHARARRFAQAGIRRPGAHAAEKAAVFVESLTVVKDGAFSSDEIKALSATVLRVDGEPKFKIIPVADDVIRYQCRLTAVVDTDNITAALLQDRQKLAEVTRRNDELQREITRLNDEMATLKKQYNSAATESERQRLRERAKQNGDNFTAARLNNDGAAAYEENRFDVAAELFTRAIALNPQYANAYYNRGNAYAQLGHYAEALRDYDRALQLNPSLTDARDNYNTVKQYVTE